MKQTADQHQVCARVKIPRLITAFGTRWIEQLLERYNASGPDALANGRRRNGLKPSLLTPEVLEVVRLRLTYTTTLHGGRRVASDYTIALVSTPQPFGGRRWWFLCPVTGSRAAVLYMPTGRTRFASQAALGGSYRTQRISPRDRAMEAAQDIRMVMGASGNLFDAFPPKPPRMHWSTYERKRERAERARDKSLAALAALLDRTRPAWRSSVVGTARG